MKRFLLITYAVVFCLLLVSCNSNEGKSNAVYNNEEYGIILEYPQGWKPNSSYSPERYEGTDGFFQISAVSGVGSGIDEVTGWDANHKLQPYGSKPFIEKLTIDGQEARLILPSEDQSAEMRGTAGIIVKYPNPVTINGERYGYFHLWADKEHIRGIGETIKFASQTSGEPGSTLTQLEEKVNQLENELSNKDISLKYLREEKDYYRAFIDKMLSNMNEKELIGIARSEWSYSLRIQAGKLDNFKAATDIPKDGIARLDGDSFGLVLSERQPPFPVLQDNIEIYNKGAVTGRYTRHLQVLDYNDYHEYPASGTVVDSMMYYFEAVPKGTVIRVKITDELKERLGMDNNIISVTVAD